MKVDARLLRAAQQCQATEDVRWYLNGIHLNAAGFIEATNGRLAIRIPVELDIDESKVISFSKKFNIAAHSCELKFLSDEYGVAIVENSYFDPDLEMDEPYHNVEELIAFRIVDLAGRKYPDINGILHSMGDPISRSKFSYRAGYLKTVADVFGDEAHVEMEFYGDDGMMKARTRESSTFPIADSVLMIMPLRAAES